MGVMWLTFIASFILGGLSFPGMFWRTDERPLLIKAASLKIKEGDEEAWERLAAPGRFTHDLKNIGHEWVKSNPKVAFKALSFLILLLLIVAVMT